MRVARAPTAPVGRAVPRPRPARPDGEVRVNRGASTRALRLSLLYGVGIAAVYAFLVALTYASSVPVTSGVTYELELAGVLAVVLGGAGIVLVLSSTPRAVLVGPEETVVIGRFGQRHHFPSGARLQTRRLHRFPPGPLASVAVESTELSGWSQRRVFMLDEGLLGSAKPP